MDIVFNSYSLIFLSIGFVDNQFLALKNGVIIWVKIQPWVLGFECF